VSHGGQKIRRYNLLVDGEKNHWEAQNRAQYYCKKVGVYTPEERKQIGKFYHDFDVWLIEVRKKRYHI